ncbi:hypothetical protein R1sor_004767 [Riccia sorocarpa]|uniref:F-box domain-containing protein n=1 Tax=Riccia sorocarpa TaxID=122646 RepID=A0ABD3HJV0_9MARC
MSGFAAAAVLGSSSSSISIPQSQTQTEVCFTLNLPIDVLMVVFGKLTPREVARLSIVCRSFSEAAKSDQLWRRWLPPNIGNLAENAYGGPVRYDSLKNLYDRIRTSDHHILMGEGREGCGIEPETGRYYLTFAARTLNITWGEDTRYWQWIPGSDVPGARFPEVANLAMVCWLHLLAEIRVRLPPGTYSLRWVLKFHEGNNGNNWTERQSSGSKTWHPVTFMFTNGGMVQSREVLFPPIREDSGFGRRLGERNNRVHWKENGWIEYVAGVFTVEEFDDPDPEATPELILTSKMSETLGLGWKQDMLVDGIVIRLADKKQYEADNVGSLELGGLNLGEEEAYEDSEPESEVSPSEEEIDDSSYELVSE